MTQRPKICVVGSINMDLVFRCVTLPVPGETIKANSLTHICGGKGANQAVAAQRAGGDVAMIGCVGNDGFADYMLANFAEESVNQDSILRCSGDSGMAVVIVEDSAENSIVILPGANAQLTPDSVRRMEKAISESEILLLQLEISVESALTAIEIARSHHLKIILDPAPAPREFPMELLQVDLVCPNEAETTTITQMSVESRDDVESAAQKLHEMGASEVVITLGNHGAHYFDGSQHHRVSAFAIDAVDTTAAGDAFAGSLAVRWLETGSLLEALPFANAAGALAASRLGAQTSLPSRHEIEKLWSSQK